MTNPELSIPEYLQHQTNAERVADYEGTGATSIREPSRVGNLHIETETTPQTPFHERIKKAGIISFKHVGENLLITTVRPITRNLDNLIKQSISQLANIAEPDTDEPLYEYTGYRTFMNISAFLCITFREVHTGATAERYFNIELRNKKGISFKTGVNCEFRVVGNTKRLQEGMFLKFWHDIVKQLPDDRLSHIYRYMNSRLSGVVVSCADTMPHHGITKLKTLKLVGSLYKLP